MKYTLLCSFQGFLQRAKLPAQQEFHSREALMLPVPRGSCAALLPGTTAAVTKHRHGAGLAAASSRGSCWWQHRGLSRHCIILVSVTKTAANTGSTMKKIPGSIIVTHSMPGPRPVLKKGLRFNMPQIFILRGFWCCFKGVQQYTSHLLSYRCSALGSNAFPEKTRQERSQNLNRAGWHRSAGQVWYRTHPGARSQRALSRQPRQPS